MSSYVQHFSDWSCWWCLDDYFWHHEYGYIKLKDAAEWHSLWDIKEWKHRVVTGEDFKRCTKWLYHVYEATNPGGPSPVENKKLTIREWSQMHLERAKKVNIAMQNNQNVIWVICFIENDLLPFLDSLEKETEELTRPCKCDACQDGIAWEEPIDWQPSTNEEIEVSNDGVKWEKKKFIKMHGRKYVTELWWHLWTRTSKFARPLVQLPEVREFKASGNTPWNLELTSISRQLEAVTTYLLALDPKLRSLFNNK